LFNSKASDDAYPLYLTVSLYHSLSLFTVSLSLSLSSLSLSLSLSLSPSLPLSIRNVAWCDASAATHSEEEIVPGLNLPSKAHEKARVDAHGNLPARIRANT
jgi:hypothetical protein